MSSCPALHVRERNQAKRKIAAIGSNEKVFAKSVIAGMAMTTPFCSSTVSCEQ